MSGQFTYRWNQGGVVLTAPDSDELVIRDDDRIADISAQVDDGDEHEVAAHWYNTLKEVQQPQWI